MISHCCKTKLCCHWFALTSLCLFTTLAMRAEGGSQMPLILGGEWQPVGRLKIETNADSVTLQGGYIVEKQAWNKAEMSVRMRAPSGAESVQLWGGFRCRDRDSRYVFALRGGD